MGFAASQARFLSLTARLSDVEYETQQITQERLAVMSQMELFSDEYDEATNNQVFVANVFDNNGQDKVKVTLSYDVIIGDIMNGGLGKSLVTNSGLIVVPDNEEMEKQIEASGGSLSAENFYIMEDIKKPETLKKNLEMGNMFIATKNENDEWDKKSVQQLNNVTSEYDKSDDAAAKSTYDKRMKIAESRDTMLEMRLNQLESEHRAIETEMEAVQKVIDDNIKNGFGTFG